MLGMDVRYACGLEAGMLISHPTEGFPDVIEVISVAVADDAGGDAMKVRITGRCVKTEIGCILLVNADHLIDFCTAVEAAALAEESALSALEDHFDRVSTNFPPLTDEQWARARAALDERDRRARDPRNWDVESVIDL
ncbi:hypothetical protein ETD86_50380 [Nonomuraea turkmeniaca]|uniref:Uncharacterized protein n=1 Tax=Nonomuraea turkmeniaca TaxID=103838 RepID=A0A5S4EW70_9ACTN|nr:hypothetical protein [Nonomuraea turkmeniaca]TMR07827.1 hypothetical protein ETD86_50380 [Nonomuraea turkmeniaca]